jgi:hypothetical protein
MIEKQKKDLEKAKKHFFAWELHEAYSILRRFFDRLPFCPETEHAVYLSYFIRCLLELGKERELDFYLKQIEELSDKWKTAELNYQLAEVYCLGTSKNLQTAKGLLTEVIANPNARHLHAKAKIFLAYCYDVQDQDVASCRRIIDSIEHIADRPTELSLELWKIKILRDEGKLVESEERLTSFMEKVDPESDWYAFFSAKILLGGLLVRQDKKKEASKLVSETKKWVENSPFRTLKMQLSALEAKLEALVPVPEVVCEQGIRAWRLTLDQKTIEVKSQSKSAELLELFLKKEWVEKGYLIRKLFKKEYEPESDDSKVHSLIHSFRKSLEGLNLGMDPIFFEEGRYRLVPKLKLLSGET